MGQMKNYIISYWLRHPETNYSKFYDSLKKNYPKYIHIMEETWFIKTTDNAKEIRNKLQNELAFDESIFVTEINMDNYAGWMATRGFRFLEKDEGLGN